MDSVFRRKAYDEMLEWKRDAHGRYALLVEGAPGVGKTTVAEHFGRREYRSFVRIDFSHPKKSTMVFFKKYDGDMDMLFSGIQASENVTLHRHESLVIFDNIQDHPEIRQLVGELVTDGRYDYIEIGILTSLERHVRSISIPSEEVGLTMHPLDFEEFLWACGDDVTFQYARDAFERRESVEPAIHAKLMNRFREYLLVGGMPSSVNEFAKNGNPRGSEDIKKNILERFAELTGKYPYNGGKQSGKIMEKIPSMLSTGNRQFSPGMVRKGSRTRDYADCVGWMKMSCCVLVCSNWDRLKLMIPPFVNEESFKCYMCDTGLLATTVMSDDVSESVLLGDMSACGSMLYENAVAQALASSGHRLVFYDHGDSVDFMLVDESRPGFVICKPMVSSKHVSFDRFLSKHPNTGECFVIHSGNLKTERRITYLPVYMAMLI